MNPAPYLVLTRLQYFADGIFGTLFDSSGKQIAVTLEHSYYTNDIWMPKIPVGNYECVRGLHQLEHMDHSFETFEITGVAGHTDLLFHTGNTNDDSAGCVLLGEDVVERADGMRMISMSRIAFEDFMSLMDGVDNFLLTIS